MNAGNDFFMYGSRKLQFDLWTIAKANIAQLIIAGSLYAAMSADRPTGFSLMCSIASNGEGAPTLARPGEARHPRSATLVHRQKRR
jgi:hypothetical protein